MHRAVMSLLLAATSLLLWMGCGTAEVDTLQSGRNFIDATSSSCGDGNRTAGEQCDDGNTRAGDGCSSLCAVESGYTCTDASFSLAYKEQWKGVGAPDPSWTLSSDGLTVRQGTNSAPAVYMTNLPASGTSLTFDLAVETSEDDDFIGWVVGFDQGDTTNPQAEFILFDWKQQTQRLDSGEVGRMGLAMSRVKGVVQLSGADKWAPFFAHMGGITEEARAINLGGRGWGDFTAYRVTMTYEPSRIRVWVNGLLEFDVAGSFPIGRFGFYTASQERSRFTLVSPTARSICGLDPNADPDGDGVRTGDDPAPFDPSICGDAEGDGTDDCAVQPEGRWVPTADMALARLLHTAVLLNDGRVLVAGGYNVTSELYDPATGSWTRTGDTLGSHRYHTMTLLRDGRVLIAGGGQCQTTGSTAEVYEPATGRWMPAGSLVTNRTHHAAALLPDGRVLVMGGTDSAGGVLASAELYDPATGAWTLTGSLAMARRDHTATVLPGGKVLVTGGSNGASVHLASAEVYDPASGTWTNVGSMSHGRSFHSATLLANGRVLVAGGGGVDKERSTSAEVFDPATGSFHATGSMTTPRRYHTATRLANGRVLVAGGYHDYTGILTASELYDPATGTWASTYSMNVDRYSHTATLLSDGRVLAVGGVSNTHQSSAELYGVVTWASCKELLAHAPGTPSGVYRIDPDGRGAGAPFEVYCEMEKDGGGWTLVMTGSDDGQDTWTWQKRLLMTTNTSSVGSVEQRHRDYKSAALHTVPFRDLLFVHAPSGVWAAYGGVGQGSQDVASFMAPLPSPVCDLSMAGNGYEMTAGTLTRRGQLCDTDLYFHMGDIDGVGEAYCRRLDGSQEPTYGPGWNIGNNGGCPFDDSTSASFGPSAHPSWVARESAGCGFGWALGLNTGASGQAKNFIQMFVR